MVSSPMWIRWVLVIVFISGGYARISKKIVGGSRASISDFPHQVSLSSKDGHFCGGSIIDAFHILTAAHCVTLEYGVFQANIKVQSGSDDIFDPAAEFHEVSIVTIHEDYDPENFWMNDIAILTLATPLTFSPNCKPIILADRTPGYGNKLTTLGWGSVLSTTRTASKYLQKYELKSVIRGYCEYFFSLYNILHRYQHCAIIFPPETKTYVSQGDGGGPLIKDEQLFGILSFSTPTIANAPVVYTDVYSYTNWIIAITAEH